jgi:hypothetical protein
MANAETEYMGGKKGKIWTYLILLILLVVGVVVANFAFNNPELAKKGVSTIAGLPSWAFAVIAFVLGVIIFWAGLKIETDWPEFVGALLIAGSVAFAQFLIGWNHFALGGLAVLPYVFPALVFIILLMIGMAKSR